MIQTFILVVLLHLSSALFENCDETFELNTDSTLTINSSNTLNVKNVSSCRYTLIAPADFIVEVSCSLQIDQIDSQKCRQKRFFISVDGVSDLRGFDFFCNRNGSSRTVRRRSVTNRLVLAYATQSEVGDDKFTCVAKRIESRCDCGWSRRTRIYNGEDAGMHEFPSMIALVALSINRVFCGGVIISRRWGLTSAHCFNEDIYANLKNIAAYVGEHDLTTSMETIYTESHQLEKFIQHEKYSKLSYDQDYDIALIKMKRPFTFNRAVGPACLPWSFNSESFDYKHVSVVGFGLLSFSGNTAKVLQKVSLQVLPAKRCKDSIKNSDKMCTYSQGKDSCTSDSGGPLYFAKGRLFVVGLVSYGVGCGTRTPSVNSRLTSYLPWIERESEGESFCRK